MTPIAMVYRAEDVQLKLVLHSIRHQQLAQVELTHEPKAYRQCAASCGGCSVFVHRG